MFSSEHSNDVGECDASKVESTLNCKEVNSNISDPVPKSNGRGLSDSKEDTVTRYRIGTKGAKLAQQEEMRTKAVHSMAQSAKRKSDALEERNAIAIFSRPEAANLPESSMFFDALRQIHLANAIKRAKLAQQESSTDHNNEGQSVTPSVNNNTEENIPAKSTETGSKRA